MSSAKITSVRAELKSLWDWGDGDLKTWEPPDAANFGRRVGVFIGWEGDSRSDMFNALVCSPVWLAEHIATLDLPYAEGNLKPWTGYMTLEAILRSEPALDHDELTAGQQFPVIFGTGLLLMRRWDHAALERTIRELCTAVEGPNWGQSPPGSVD